MEIEIWDGGLQEQEVTAIEKIKVAFTGKANKQQRPARGSSLREQLKSSLANVDSGMFPWKGYAGFRFVDSKNHDGEFDLIIVTHCNVIIVN